MNTDKDQRVITRAQNRVLEIYREKGRPGGWRGVADFLARRVGLPRLNVAYIYDFVSKGKVPSNVQIRAALFLPRVLPSERKPRSAKPVVHIGDPDWERLYFRLQLRRGRPSKESR